MSEELTPLEKLGKAIQEFVNANADEPILVDQALVVWEEVTLDDKGEARRRVLYSVPSDNFTLTGVLGLLRAGKYFIERDILKDGEEDL